MFKTVSKGGVGAAGTLLYLALVFMGIEVDEESVMAFVTNAFGAGSFLLWLYGQFKRSDLVMGLWRKDADTNPQ